MRHATCLASILALACASAAAAAAAALPWEAWRSPARFAAVDADALVVAHSSACPGGCRYDRSNSGPEPPAANPYPLRWLYRDGDEVVLFDERGAGALTRLWMTTGDGVSRCFDPALRVRLRVDDTVPVIDAPLASLFDGSMAPFTPPLAADRLATSGGQVSRVPIAYTRSLRLGLVGAESGNLACDPSGWGLLWYQAQFHRLASATTVPAFPAFDESGLRAFLDTPVGTDPWHGLLAPAGFTYAGVTGPATLTLGARSGPGWLRGIRLGIPMAQWPHLRLRFQFDGHAGFDLDVGDFFAVDAAGSARSLLSGLGDDGVLHAWWPMPYARAARIELVVDGAAVMPFDVAGSLSFDAATPPIDAHFHAAASEACGTGDRLVYADRGAGKLVAVSARYAGGADSGFGVLEGDERIHVDDALAPAWHGTGVEDFFDGGFYFDQGPVLAALAGAPRVASAAGGVTAAYRIFLGDAPAWTSAVRVIQEAGALPVAASPACTRHVVFAYRRAQRLVGDVAGFEVGDADAVTVHDYRLPQGATCVPLAASFPDEPPSARAALVCRYGVGGGSRFRFALGHGFERPLRLRRTFDAGEGVPGEVAGAPAAEVRLDGKVVGVFPPAMANPPRRWQQQEILLDTDAAPRTLGFEVVVLPTPAAARFSESAWTLRAVLSDHLHADGFDGGGRAR